MKSGTRQLTTVVSPDEVYDSYSNALRGYNLDAQPAEVRNRIFEKCLKLATATASRKMSKNQFKAAIKDKRLIPNSLKVKMHTMVVSAFFQTKYSFYNGYEVDHINQQKKQNVLFNLERLPKAVHDARTNKIDNPFVKRHGLNNWRTTVVSSIVQKWLLDKRVESFHDIFPQYAETFDNLKQFYETEATEQLQLRYDPDTGMIDYLELKPASEVSVRLADLDNLLCINVLGDFSSLSEHISQHISKVGRK
jgi:hypothetical protein